MLTYRHDLLERARRSSSDAARCSSRPLITRRRLGCEHSLTSNSESVAGGRNELPHRATRFGMHRLSGRTRHQSQSSNSSKWEKKAT